MRRKLLCVMLVVVLVASAVMMLACNNNNGNNANFVVPEGGYDGSAVTIKFYHTMGQNLRDVLDLYIPEFNKIYPNITIEHEQVGSYDDVRTQVSTEINVGAQPNIAYCYPDHVALYNVAGAVVQLDNLIASTEEGIGLSEAQIADFVPGYYNEGKQFGDGFMYTMPLSKSSEVLYYNKDFFAANDLSVPTTWDEMEAVCKIIKEEIDPDCIPLGYDSEANWFITMCEQYGSPYTSAEEDSDHFLFNNDTNKPFVKRFREWFQKGYVTTQELYGAYTSELFTELSQEADAQRCYMCIGSTGGAAHQVPSPDVGQTGFEVGIATIPQVNANNPKVISQGPSLCIFGKENPQEVIASWLFVKFLTTNVDFQAEFSYESGYAPVIQSVTSNADYAAYLNSSDVKAMATKVCLQQANAYYTSPAFNGSSMARDEVGNLMQKCLSGEASDVDAFINQAFIDAVNECEYNS